MRITFAVAAVFAALGALPAVAAAPKKITPSRVGKVRLQATYASMHAKGLVGKSVPGCELDGPNARAAKLRAPLKGAVDLTRSSPRRIKSIEVTGGATARGVGIGARKADIVHAFPKATFDHSTEDVFQITLVKIPRGGGGRIQMGLSTKTHRVTLIGIPAIPFCD